MKEKHNRPILSEDLEDRITDAIQAFLHKGLWKEWGLDKVRDQGAAILLHGPPGCISGSTILTCRKKNHSRSVSVKQLYKAWIGRPEGKGYKSIDSPIYLPSYSLESGIVFYNQVIDIMKSGIKEVYRLETDIAGYIDATIDHPILVEDGSYKELGKLAVSETLLVKGSFLTQGGKGRRPLNERPYRENVYGLKYYSSGRQHYHQSYELFKYQLRSRLVIEAELNSLSYKEYVRRLKTDPEAIHLKVLDNSLTIHHKDKDPGNNELDNLEVLTKEQHDKLHADIASLDLEYTKLAKVTNIRSLGRQMTYDIQMQSPANNFAVNNGIFVHNTGKSISAYYIARRLRARISELSFAEYGSHVPGELARNIKKFFGGELLLARQEKTKQLPVIFMDECDACLVSRNKLGPDMIWMLEPINALLTEIAKYPGLVILATNQSPMLDEALDRRLLAKIKFGRPDQNIRYKIWRAKWPDKFPYQPTEEEFSQLARFDLTGAQIENAFLLWAGRCMRAPNLTPTAKSLAHFMSDKLPKYNSED